MEIIINVSLVEVWKMFFQFEVYFEWNFFICLIKGKVIIGEQIEV